MEEWMTNLPTAVAQLPLRQVAIPGSHDSGAFYLDINSPISPGEPKVIKALAKFGGCARRVIYNWSVTQSVSIKEQLDRGIRYLDIRTVYDKKENDFFVVHGLYGLKTGDILEQVSDFISAHPKEVVILDFNHLLNISGPLHERLVALIRNTFQGKLCEVDLGPDTSLAQIWASGAQVIACYHNDEITGKCKDLWPGQTIYSPWPNTSSTSKLVRYLNDRYSDLRGGSLNVFQAVLTPQTTTIMAHLTGSLRKTLGLKCDDTVKGWLQSVEAEKRTGTNIVMCDFADLDEWIEGTLKLNQVKMGFSR